MCVDPVTIGAIAASTAGPAIATGFKAKEAYDEGKFQANQADFNASVAEQNATDALERGKVSAQDTVARGEVNAGRIEGQAVKTEAELVAAAGASGFDAQSSSYLDLVAGSRAAAELDALTVRNDAAREAWGLKTNSKREADALKMQASQLRGEAKRLRDRTFWDVTGTLLGGAAQTVGAGVGGKGK